MTIAVNYGNFSGLTGVTGLKSYLNYYEATYSDPVHHGSSAFSTGSSSSVKIGSTTIPSSIADYQYAGSSSGGVAFIAQAGSVANVYDGTSTYTLDQLGYTLFQSPQHTLFGNLASVVFGDSYTTSGGVNTINTAHLTVTGIGDTAGYGLVWNSGAGYYDAILDYTTGNNPTHNVVYGLMGGLGSNTQIDPLEDIFDQYGITVVGTSNSETFDGYAGADIFKTEGGVDDIYNFDEAQDVVGLKTSIYGFGSPGATLGAVQYDAITDEAYIQVGGNKVTLVGIDSTVTLTNANFSVY